MKSFFFIWIGSFIVMFGFSQQSVAQVLYNISGKIVDGDSSALILANASLSISPTSDTSRKKYYSADDKGGFSIPAANGEYVIEFTFTGYDVSRRNIKVSGANLALGRILMFKKLQTLNDVTLVAKVPPARQKGDTTEINAAALKVNPDATVEDLVKKAPGVTVENGQITAQGEQVQRVTIDGREYFGNDAAAALRNLPAEVVEKIQVFDRMSDQAQLTGVSDGNEVKSINIVTKANMRNGQFGRIYGGVGTNERYAAGGNVNIFNKNRRINLLGLFNNVNQQNFSADDLLGVSGQANQGGARGGRPAGGGGGGRPGSNWGGGGGNFFTPQQAGIATTNAVGINFSDLWANKKMEVTGSYFFNNSTTQIYSETKRESFLGDTSLFYREVNSNVTRNNNHRFNTRIEYKIDSQNTLIFNANYSFQDNLREDSLVGGNRTSKDELINSTVNVRENQAKGYNIRNEITYRRAFAKKGRSISINLNSIFNKRNVEAYLDAITGSIKGGGLVVDTLRQFTDNRSLGNTLSGNVTYSHPIGKNDILQFIYNPTVINSEADQKNLFFEKATGDYTRFDTTQSNLFDNKTIVHNGGLNYRVGQRGDLTVGLNYQYTKLLSEQLFPKQTNVNKKFNNFLPNFSYRKNFSRNANLRIRYRTSVNTPSVNQLQNVVNITNPLFLRSGNAELGQSYTHFMFAQFNATLPQKSRSFFAGIFAQRVNNYITNGNWVASADSVIQNGIVLRKGAQFTKPVNIDGYWNLRSFANYGFPLKSIKSNLSLNAGVGYIRTPGQVNGVSNYTNAYNVSGGLAINSNISELIDYTFSYTGTFNNAVNSFNPNLNNRFYQHSIGAKLNLLSKKGWFVLNDLTNLVFSGLADGFNQNFWLWNVSAGKKFLEKQRGEVKFTVFDLLSQNQSVTRTVDALYIEDVQTVVLRQYFMLTFTYTLRNFGKNPVNNTNMRQNSDFRRP